MTDMDQGQYEAEVEAAYAERDALLEADAGSSAGGTSGAALAAMSQMRDMAAADSRYFTPKELLQHHAYAAEAAIESRQALEEHGPEYFETPGRSFVGVGRLDGPYGQHLSTAELHAYSAELQAQVAAGLGWVDDGWAAGRVPAQDDGRAR